MWRPGTLEDNEVGWGLPKGVEGVGPGAGGFPFPAVQLLHCCIVARVVPVFKGKGEDPTDFAGYCPVSVLPVLSQVFERVLQARLALYFAGPEGPRD